MSNYPYRQVEVYDLGSGSAGFVLSEDNDGIRVLTVPDGQVPVPPHLVSKAIVDSVAMVVGPVDSGWIHTELVEHEAGPRRSKVLAEPVSFAQFATMSVTGGKPFVSVHTHSQYSPLDGLSTLPELLDLVSEYGQPALAITDHGYCAAHAELQTVADQYGVKAIPGLEAYFVPNRRLKENQWDYNHLILWGMTDQGLLNLWGLSTAAHRPESFYRYPRCDWDLLKEFREGLSASSACLRGPLSDALLNGRVEEAIASLGRMQNIFGENFYLEVHTNQLPQQIELNKMLVEMGKLFSVPLIAAVDSHYARYEDYDTHQIWLAAQMSAQRNTKGNSKTDGTDDQKLFAGRQDYHLMSRSEVESYLSYLPPEAVAEAVDNTFRLSEKVTARVPTSNEPPIYSVQYGRSYAEQQARKICEANWERKIGKSPEVSDEIMAVYRERFEFEMALLESKKFIDYFMIVADYVSAGKKAGYLIGPGRGCLDGDTQILTRSGLMSISDIKVGDEVRNRLGRWCKVVNTYVYDVSEELVSLDTFYGSSTPLVLTQDHHVWVRKGIPEVDRQRVAQGYKWSPGAMEPGWLAASEVNRGDLMGFPVPVSSDDAPAVLDLAIYAEGPVGGYEVTDTHVIELVPHNQHSASNDSISIRAVARGSGVSGPVVTRIYRGIPGVLPRNEALVRKWLVERGVSLDEWRSQSMTVETRLNRFIPVDADFCRVMGMWASNGWCKRRDSREVGFATRFSASDEADISLVSRVLGLDHSTSVHATKDVVSWIFRSHLIRNLFVDLFSGYDFVAQSKRLPNWVFALDEECRDALVQGLWWGDGSHKGRSSYTTSSPFLRDQVRDLLWSLGRPAGLTVDDRQDERPGWRNKSIAWKITTTPLFGPMRRQHGLTSEDGYVWVTVDKVGRASGTRVYDLEVEGGDPSFTTSSGIVHNSGAASLAAYLLDITEVDPVKYDLLFARFMTRGRVDPPDFDLDFPSSSRAWFQHYLAERWGFDNIARVGSHTRLKNKGAFRKLYQVYKSLDRYIDFADIDKICKIIDEEEASSAGMGYEWDHIWSNNEESLAPFRAKYPFLFDSFEKIVGRINTYGKHAAGMIISTGKPLSGKLPMRGGDEDQMVSEFDYRASEKMGLLKFDLLTLRTLDTLQLAMDLVRQRRGIELNLYDFRSELEDPLVWDAFCAGDTLGVFQFERRGMINLLKQVEPRNILELADINALVRPGPRDSGLQKTYIRRRTGVEAVEYPHPLLEDTLRPTQGTFLYQEQVQAAGIVLARYDDVESNYLRSILSKKKVKEADEEGRKFVARCVENGHDKDVCEGIWNQLVAFSRYSFNKSHAVSYSFISFYCAWFKVHYPEEFYTACLSTVDQDRVPDFVSELQKIGFSVLPPDINHSRTDFTPAPMSVRYGFKAIKGLGDVACKRLEEGQPYFSYEDFRARTKVNSGAIKLLAAVGALDSLYPNRKELEYLLTKEFEGDFEVCVHRDESRTSVAPNNLPCAFDWSSEPVEYTAKGAAKKPKPPPRRCTKACRHYTPTGVAKVTMEPYSDTEIRNREKEILGVWLSSTPFDRIDPEDRKLLLNAQQLDEAPICSRGQTYQTVGIIRSTKKIATKMGDPMGFVGVLAQTDFVDFVVFPQEWKIYSKVLKVGQMALFSVSKTSRGIVMKQCVPV